MKPTLKGKQPIGGLKRPKWDPRRFSWKRKFGAIVGALPTNDFDVWTPLYTYDQGLSELCSDFGTIGAAEPHVGVPLDPAAQRAAHNAVTRLPGYVGPSDPDSAARAILKIGALPFAKAPYTIHDDPSVFADLSKYPPDLVMQMGTNKELSVYDVDAGADRFDSIRIAMQQGMDAKFPTVVMVGTIWRQSWINAPGGIVTQDNKKEFGEGHEFVIVGQKTINGELYLKAHLSSGQVGDCSMPPGGFFYFPRSVVNNFLFAKAFGQGNPNDYKDQLWSTWQKVYDLFFTIYQSFMGKPKESAVPAPHISRITDWAKAIASQEGANPKFNNPGNLKYSTLTASWGGTKGFAAQDGGSICSFPTPEAGMQALCNFLTLGAQDELLAFHNARTIRLFTKVYANPPKGSRYAENVAAALGVDIDYPISNLL